MNAPEQLRAWRETHGLSQAAAAERVGVSQPTWSDWEAGKKLPHIAQAIRLEKEAGVPVMAWADAAMAKMEQARLRKTGTEG